MPYMMPYVRKFWRDKLANLNQLEGTILVNELHACMAKTNYCVYPYRSTGI